MPVLLYLLCHFVTSSKSRIQVVSIKKTSILVLITVVFSAIAMVVCTKVYSVITLTNCVKEKLPGLSDAQYEHALRNISTAPNYVLIWIVDKSKEKNEKKQICVEGPYLLESIQDKYDLNTYKLAIQFALEQKDRTYELDIERHYTEDILNEVRAILAGRTEKEIEKLIDDYSHNSPLYELYRKRSAVDCDVFSAIAHALSERGMLCGRLCKYGWFYIDEWKENQVYVPVNESPGKTSTIY
jgi:hypothetical protein